MNERKDRNRYSVAFKMKVAEEIESGMLSIVEACKLYGIPGQASVWEWVKRYGMNERINKAVYIMTQDEERELIRLRKENRRLQQALDDSQIKNMALESILELAEEKYGISIKKNFGAQVLEELRKKLLPSGSEKE